MHLSISIHQKYNKTYTVWTFKLMFSLKRAKRFIYTNTQETQRKKTTTEKSNRKVKVPARKTYS